MTTQAAKRRTFLEILELPPAPRTGRGRLVAAAVWLFYKHGFGAVGIDQVIYEAGVTKSTFYKHFESKVDLMVAAVDSRDAWEKEAWGPSVRRFARSDDPREQLLAAFDVIDVWFNDPDFHGCMFVTAALEFPNPTDPVHEAAARHRRRMYEERRGLALATGADAATATKFTDCYTALLEGALAIRQADGRHDAARTIRPAVESLIDAWLPGRREAAATSSPAGRRRAAARG
jgi:AcrR family transcriptional regulator